MVRKYAGKELAKVLIYYGLIEQVYSSEFNIVCPFHGDINPSMRINLEEGSYFCFGCGRIGNALDFVKSVNPELNDLKAGMELERILHSKEIQKLQIKYKRRSKKNNQQAIDEAHDYYYGLKTVDWHNPETKEEVVALEYMKQRGFNEKALHIAKCKVDYNIAYPIIFPLIDNGVFKGWVARTTSKTVEKTRCKYMYNEGFRKRNTLCGTYSENKPVFVCEGFMDYLSLKTRGHIKNVVALLGWHMSDEQMEELKVKGITTVISALDNDKAGNKGTEYLKKFFNVIPFAYPEGIKDTGEMTEKQLKVAIRRTKKRYENSKSKGKS